MTFIVCYGAYFMYFGPKTRGRFLAIGIGYMIIGFAFLIKMIKKKKIEKKDSES